MKISSKLHASGELKFSSAQPTLLSRRRHSRQAASTPCDAAFRGIRDKSRASERDVSSTYKSLSERSRDSTKLIRVRIIFRDVRPQGRSDLPFCVFCVRIFFCSHTMTLFFCLTQNTQNSQRTHHSVRVASGMKISSKLHASGELKFSSAQPTLLSRRRLSRQRERSDSQNFVNFVLFV